MQTNKLGARFRSLDFRLVAGSFGLIAQGIAWSSVFIAVLFAVSKMPSLFQRIPPEIQFACELLAALAIVLLFRMLVERRRALRACAQLADALAPFHAGTREERITGISPDRLERIRTSCNSLIGGPREWWQALDEALEYYESPGAQGGWFITRPVQEILPDEELVEPFYHASFHQAVPGILTALGLLATFSAILIALSGVSYNAANTAQPIAGIDTLINGLAGKFLSSIIALILSMIFTFVEKKVCERQIFQRADALRSRIRHIFPFLSQTRILLDLQRIALAASFETIPETEPRPVAAAEPVLPGAAESHVQSAASSNGAGALISEPLFEPAFEAGTAPPDPLPAAAQSPDHQTEPAQGLQLVNDPPGPRKEDQLAPQFRI